MKALIQRVTRAKVTVQQQIVGEIDSGLLVLLGIDAGDSESVADRLASKVANYRVFADDSEPVSRTELLKLRGQLKETRTALRDMTALYQEDVYELRTQMRYIFHAVSMAKEGREEEKVEISSEFKDLRLRIDALEN